MRSARCVRGRLSAGGVPEVCSMSETSPASLGGSAGGRRQPVFEAQRGPLRAAKPMHGSPRATWKPRWTRRRPPEDDRRGRSRPGSSRLVALARQLSGVTTTPRNWPAQCSVAISQRFCRATSSALRGAGRARAARRDGAMRSATRGRSGGGRRRRARRRRRFARRSEEGSPQVNIDPHFARRRDGTHSISVRPPQRHADRGGLGRAAAHIPRREAGAPQRPSGRNSQPTMATRRVEAEQHVGEIPNGPSRRRSGKAGWAMATRDPRARGTA